MSKQPISVQIHLVPFEQGLAGAADRQAYLQALQVEFAGSVDYAEDVLVESLCVTGTNPLQYPGERIAALIRALRGILPFQKNAEITVCAMPGSVNYGDILALREQAVTKISFDMGSFVQAELDSLGRTYAPSAIEVFMRMVQRKVTFFDFDVTLSLGLEGQTVETFHRSVEEAIRNAATHVTLQPVTGADPVLVRALYQEALNVLSLTSFQQYTPRHFARPVFASLYNRHLYANQPRLGFGVGTISTMDGQQTTNTVDPAVYMAAQGDPSQIINGIQAISPADRELAYVLDHLFTLRVCDLAPVGVELRDRVAGLCQRGLLAEKDDQVVLTPAGKAEWEAVEAGLSR